MPFARKPTPDEQKTAQRARRENPNLIRTEATVAISTRRRMTQMVKMLSRELARIKYEHDAVGGANLRASLGDADYDDFVADFNVLRSAVLQASPGLAEKMPESL